MPRARADQSHRRREDCARKARLLRGREHSHARGLRHSRAGAQTALACSTRLAPRVRRLENSPGTGMPQPTRGVWFGSCDITAHGNLDPPAGRALGFRLNPWMRLVVVRFRSARSRAQSESQRSESDLRSQKSETEEKENRKRGNGKSKMGDGIHGVLATRNPTSTLEPSGMP